MKTGTHTPKRYLLVCTLRLGDLLLATPVVHSIRLAQPDGVIDVLVLNGMGGMLEGNPYINRVIETPHRSPWYRRLKEWIALWNRYDIALTPVSSDRARLYCYMAAPRSIGFVNPHSSWLSMRLLTQQLPFDDEHTHTVTLGLRLVKALGLPTHGRVIPPTAGGTLPASLNRGTYAVLHPYPKFRYKMWPEAHWVDLARRLVREGIPVVVTGGHDPEDRDLTARLAREGGALDLAGALSRAQAADLVAGSRLFVGTDTGMPHGAAATGVPVVALFGPVNPVKWGPWPREQEVSDGEPWHMKGSQHRGNVFLVQGKGDCVPCRQEGCDHHRQSASRCLENLSVDEVWTILGHALAFGASRG